MTSLHPPHVPCLSHRCSAAVDVALDKLVKIEIPEGWRAGEVRAGARLRVRG